MFLFKGCLLLWTLSCDPPPPHLPLPLPASVKVMKHPLFVCLCGDIVALGLVTKPSPPSPPPPPPLSLLQPHPSTPTPGTSVHSSTSAGDKNKLALSKFHERMSLRNTKAFFRLFAARSVINWCPFTRQLQVPGFQLSCGKKTNTRKDLYVVYCYLGEGNNVPFTTHFVSVFAV